MLTKKHANALVKQLQQQLASTTHETRKSMRARLASAIKENEELKKKVLELEMVVLVRAKAAETPEEA